MYCPPKVQAGMEQQPATTICGVMETSMMSFSIGKSKPTAKHGRKAMPSSRLQICIGMEDDATKSAKDMLVKEAQIGIPQPDANR